MTLNKCLKSSVRRNNINKRDRNYEKKSQAEIKTTVNYLKTTQATVW